MLSTLLESFYLAMILSLCIAKLVFFCNFDNLLKYSKYAFASCDWNLLYYSFVSVWWLFMLKNNNEMWQSIYTQHLFDELFWRHTYILAWLSLWLVGPTFSMFLEEFQVRVLSSGVDSSSLVWRWLAHLLETMQIHERCNANHAHVGS